MLVQGEDNEGTCYPLHGAERWFAVQTQPRAEDRARLQLANQKFRAFLPKRECTIRHARRIVNAIRPFFPRYLFVVLDLTRDQWRSVNGTFGVASLVMSGNYPGPVPTGVVESMVASADRLGVLQLRHKFKIGESIRLAAGPFAEQLAVIDRLDDSGRIRVLLQLMGQQVRVLTDGKNVLPLARSA